MDKGVLLTLLSFSRLHFEPLYLFHLFLFFVFDTRPRQLHETPPTKMTAGVPECGGGPAVLGTDCVREEEAHMSSIWDPSTLLRDKRACRIGTSAAVCGCTVVVRDYTVSEWGGGEPRGDVGDPEWVGIQ